MASAPAEEESGRQKGSSMTKTGGGYGWMRKAGGVMAIGAMGGVMAAGGVAAVGAVAVACALAAPLLLFLSPILVGLAIAVTVLVAGFMAAAAAALAALCAASWLRSRYHHHFHYYASSKQQQQPSGIAPPTPMQRYIAETAESVKDTIAHGAAAVKGKAPEMPT